MTELNSDNRGRSLNRIRMQYLYAELQGVTRSKELLSKLKELPVTLRTNGLATISAQLNASSESKDQIVCNLLARWLLVKCPVMPWQKSEDEKLHDAALRSMLLHRCMHAGHLEYETAQTEALLFLEQTKLIAAALWTED